MRPIYKYLVIFTLLILFTLILATIFGYDFSLSSAHTMQLVFIALILMLLGPALYLFGIHAPSFKGKPLKDTDKRVVFLGLILMITTLLGIRFEAFVKLGLFFQMVVGF